jgi:hypothetical protein
MFRSVTVFKIATVQGHKRFKSSIESSRSERNFSSRDFNLAGPRGIQMPVQVQLPRLLKK